jgi:tRNA/rRNA methyltransferase
VTGALKRCRVVLVRPHYAGNLGAVARAMTNFGLTELVLVGPIADRFSSEAQMMATRGKEILAAARVVPTFAEAVDDCSWVVATSGEVRGLMRQGFWATPEQQLPALLDALAVSPTATAAIVFGPEPSGLSVAEVTACQAMIFIPTADESTSLNLAQAVTVCLYELRRLAQKRPGATPPADAEPPATYGDLERLFERLKVALVAVRFLWDERTDGIFHVVRQVLTRARPTMKEVQVFHGLARQLSHVARFWGVTHPADGRPPKQPPAPAAESSAGPPTGAS